MINSNLANQPTTLPTQNTPISKEDPKDEIKNLFEELQAIRSKDKFMFENFLQSEKKGGYLSKSLKENFPLRDSSNPQERLNQAQPKPELNNHQLTEILNYISVNSGICIGTVYRYLENYLMHMVKTNKIATIFSNNNRLMLQKMVEEKWHSNRIMFLKMQNDLLNAHDNDKNIDLILGWVKKNKNELFVNSIESLEQLIHLKVAKFKDSNSFIKTMTKFKEQKILLTNIFSLIVKSDEDLLEEQYAAKLFKLIISSRFIGIFSENDNNSNSKEYYEWKKETKIICESMTVLVFLGGDLLQKTSQRISLINSFFKLFKDKDEKK